MPKPKKQPIKAQPGDKIRLSCGPDEYTGILLPRKQGSSEFVTIKLSSGYNIGISKARIKKTQILERSAAKIGQRQKIAPKQGQEGAQNISLLACGGTIASRIDYSTGAVYPATTPQELVVGFPKELKGKVKAKTLFTIQSEDLAPLHWEKIAKAAAGEIKQGAKGVIITHGTDTMAYTSSMLSFMLQNLPCPIVLTGSQRSSDRGSSDAQANLYCSLLAASADLSGVFVCMHENMSDSSCFLHFGTKVRKMHTSRRDAFRAINVMPAARIFPGTGKIEKLSNECASRNKASLSLDTKMNTNVAIQYIYPGVKPKAISSLSKYDGIVLIGTGLGHLPVNLRKEPLAIPILNEVSQLIKSGIPVVLVSQTIYGRVDMNVYTNQRVLLEAGVIGNLCDFTPESAYTKLMWVLGREKKIKKVKELMETNIVGEISSKTQIANY